MEHSSAPHSPHKYTHGSEDYNETTDSPRHSPGSGTGSHTVSYPPGFQHFGSPIRAERNPLLRPEAQAEMETDARGLSEVTQSGLIRHLEGCKVPADVITQISAVGLSGRQWVGIYGRGDDAEAVTVMMSDFPGLSSLKARMLRVDAVDALKESEVVAEIEQVARKARAGGRVEPTGATASSHRGYKVETAPRMPTPANKLMYTSQELSTVFSKLILWLGPKSKGMARSMETIKDAPEISRDAVCELWEDLPEKCATLDAELAAEIVNHLPKCFETEVVKIKANHKIGESASSLQILRTLKSRVEKKTSVWSG